MEETSRRDLFLFDFISFEISEKQILSPFFLSGDRIIFSESVYNLPASEIVIISSLSASLLNLTVSIDPNTACCIETIVKNKANGERIIFIWWVCLSWKFWMLNCFWLVDIERWVLFYKSEESDNGKMMMSENVRISRFHNEHENHQKYAYTVTRAYLWSSAVHILLCLLFRLWGSDLYRLVMNNTGFLGLFQVV